MSGAGGFAPNAVYNGKGGPFQGRQVVSGQRLFTAAVSPRPSEVGAHVRPLSVSDPMIAPYIDGLFAGHVGVVSHLNFLLHREA